MTGIFTAILMEELLAGSLDIVEAKSVSAWMHMCIYILKVVVHTT